MSHNGFQLPVKACHGGIENVKFEIKTRETEESSYITPQFHKASELKIAQYVLSYRVAPTASLIALCRCNLFSFWGSFILPFTCFKLLELTISPPWMNRNTDVSEFSLSTL